MDVAYIISPVFAYIFDKQNIDGSESFTKINILALSTKQTLKNFFICFSGTQSMSNHFFFSFSSFTSSSFVIMVHNNELSGVYRIIPDKSRLVTITSSDIITNVAILKGNIFQCPFE